MGKFVGFIGTISGKVGNIVFVKGEKGTSYGRTYQPSVANPKSVAQTDQRAKMNLVGRISQITPREVLVGLDGANNRQRRSNFTSRLLKAAVIDRSVPGSVMAKIEPDSIVFAQGSEVIRASMAAPSITASSVSVNLTLTDETLAGRYGERIVVTVIDPSEKAGYSIITYKDTVLDATSAQTVTVTMGADMESESLVCVYRLPFVLNEEGRQLRYETLKNNGTDLIAQLLERSNNYTKGWGQSTLAATQVFTQA